MYRITVEEDGGKITFTREYESCVEAVHDYDKFVDAGTAKYERYISLTDPRGYRYFKVFTTYSLVKTR
jgi:flagellum-specific peptidoglycan hydrolase FlgJ